MNLCRAEGHNTKAGLFAFFFLTACWHFSLLHTLSVHTCPYFPWDSDGFLIVRALSKSGQLVLRPLYVLQILFPQTVICISTLSVVFCCIENLMFME